MCLAAYSFLKQNANGGISKTVMAGILLHFYEFQLCGGENRRRIGWAGCISQGGCEGISLVRAKLPRWGTECSFNSPNGPLGMSFSSALEMLINRILTEKWVFDIRFVEK
jgi:hypothetical protein